MLAWLFAQQAKDHTFLPFMARLTGSVVSGLTSATYFIYKTGRDGRVDGDYFATGLACLFWPLTIVLGAGYLLVLDKAFAYPILALGRRAGAAARLGEQQASEKERVLAASIEELVEEVEKR